MKKQSQNDPDIVALMTKIQEQLASLEKKVDSLISRSLPQARPSAQPSSVQVVHAHPDISSGARFSDPPKGRPMYQAVCADCKKDCEIPFKPSGDRPVYCKECFMRRRSSNTLKVNTDNKFKVTPPVPAVMTAAVSIQKPPAKEKKKPAAAKKSAGKKTPVSKKKKK
jgi:CxxC-x17-CxxC domain-containing protein